METQFISRRVGRQLEAPLQQHLCSEFFSLSLFRSHFQSLHPLISFFWSRFFGLLLCSCSGGSGAPGRADTLWWLRSRWPPEKPPFRLLMVWRNCFHCRGDGISGGARRPREGPDPRGKQSGSGKTGVHPLFLPSFFEMNDSRAIISRRREREREA